MHPNHPRDGLQAREASGAGPESGTYSSGHHSFGRFAADCEAGESDDYRLRSDALYLLTDGTRVMRLALARRRAVSDSALTRRNRSAGVISLIRWR